MKKHIMIQIEEDDKKIIEKASKVLGLGLSSFIRMEILLKSKEILKGELS